MELIGRESEINTFKHCLNASESKLIAVYGRRRVGKTFLIRNFFDGIIRFEVSGLYQGILEDQLLHFANTLAKAGYYPASVNTPSNWLAAFDLLALYIDSFKDEQKKVIFIDELPWFDTPRSKFLMAFENFWNSYCSKRNDILVVICGSAASWMMKKILQNKGGLHNRVAEKIRLNPFSLYETEKFLQNKGINWSKYDITQLYMSTGGIPYYLDAVRKGESVVQFIDRACFRENGVLTNEYQELFQSLFDNSQHHHAVVNELAKIKKGLSREQIIQKTTLSTGGTLTLVLDELEKSGFIEVSNPYTGAKKETFYQLNDFFILFYFQFMAKKNTDSWAKKVMSASWKSWSGLAFERICFAHIEQIKYALGLQVIDSKIANWRIKAENSGAEIDLIIDRSDRVVNVCEIKFTQAEFTIDKVYASNLRNKIAKFSELAINKRKNLFLTLITTFGTENNEYYKELVQSEVTLDAFFVKR
jgi:uncharacterized protein